MKIRLTRNLQMGFGLSLFILISISVASYISIQNLFESSHWVDHSNLVIRKLEYTASVMKDAETGQRGFLLTGDYKFLEPYNGAYRKAIKSVNEVQELTIDNPQMQSKTTVIKEILVKRLKILQRLIDKREIDEIITVNDLNASKLAMDSLRVAINDAEKVEDVLLQTHINELDRYTSQTPLFLIFATLLAIAISMLSYLKVTDGIAESTGLFFALQKKEQETAAANEEIAASNEELSATNEELAASSEEVVLANEELYSTNEELTEANKQLIEAQQSVILLNEKLGTSNEELSATLDELYQSQLNLQALNDELEERVVDRTKALVESESRFRVMMETIPQIAWTNTTSGEVTFYNKQWYVYNGLDHEQSKGWGTIIHPDDLSYTIEKYKSILGSGKEGEFETREKRADGEYRWHLVRMEPVVDDMGNVQLWVGTATDIHELKNLQQQKDDFISIASHELKTPITSLKISLQLLDKLKETPLAPTLPKLISQANRSLNKVSVLVDDLLNASKLTQGQLHLNKTYFNINQLINDCCQDVRIRDLFSIITTGDLELQAYGDAERIEQVIVNFVNNAMKYASESKEINVKIEKENGMAKVSVGDKGPGIPSDKVPHLFERYYQVDSAGKQYSGLGLGLYISSEIIKKHGGQIGVDTEVGKGSTFWFKLPLKG